MRYAGEASVKVFQCLEFGIPFLPHLVGTCLREATGVEHKDNSAANEFRLAHRYTYKAHPASTSLPEDDGLLSQVCFETYETRLEDTHFGHRWYSETSLSIGLLVHVLLDMGQLE
jgi:hypothetical protein